MIDTYLNTTATPAQYANYVTQWQHGVPIADAVTAAPFIKALGAVQLMAKDNLFQPGFLGVTQAADAEALFLAQRSGFLLDGTWTVASVLNAKPGATFDYNWTLFPPAPGGSGRILSPRTRETPSGSRRSAPKGPRRKVP